MNNPKNRATNPRLLYTKLLLLIVSFVALIAGIIGASTIYTNNKTDGLNNGQITVTSCIEKDWAWKIYSCTGDYFSTGGGMVERQGVSVTVFGEELKKGQIVDDVYPPTSQSNMTTDHFVTGRERASVTYNLPSLTLVFTGILLPLFTIIFFVTNPKKKA